MTFFEPHALDRQRHRDIDDPPWCQVVVYPATEDGLHAALDRAADAEVLIKASGVGVFDTEMELAVLERDSSTAPGFDLYRSFIGGRRWSTVGSRITLSCLGK